MFDYILVVVGMVVAGCLGFRYGRNAGYQRGVDAGIELGRDYARSSIVFAMGEARVDDEIYKISHNGFEVTARVVEVRKVLQKDEPVLAMGG